MINFTPIFPLDVVVYPGETLNLHIFEPRYKQLIKDCIAAKKSFGIPVVLDGKMQDLGMLMEITELVKEYDNGEMDIRTRGLKVFRILEVVKELPDKLYHGAIVEYPNNIMEPDDSNIAKLIVEEVKRMYTLLNAEDKFPADLERNISYTVAHFVGFNKQQEYEVLGLLAEVQRLEYIRRHLNTMMPTIKELEEVKKRIKLNGHFRDLSLDDFNL